MKWGATGKIMIDVKYIEMVWTLKFKIMDSYESYVWGTTDDVLKESRNKFEKYDLRGEVILQVNKRTKNISLYS